MPRSVKGGRVFVLANGIALGAQQWPTCLYHPQELCGASDEPVSIATCDCPSCPLKVAVSQAISQSRGTL